MLERIRARHAWAVCVLTLAVSGVCVLVLGTAGGAPGAQKQQLVADSAKLAATSHVLIPGKLSSCGDIANLPGLAANPQYPTADVPIV